MNTRPEKLIVTETLQMWRGLIEKSNHILVNQLNPINTKNLFLLQISPALLKGYQLAIDNKLMEPEIEPHLLEGIDTITNLEVHTKRMFDVLQAWRSLKEALGGKNISSLSATTLITQVLEAYPFKNDERSMVQLQSGLDFNFCFPSLLIEAALIQLFDLTFQYGYLLDEKKIYIHTEGQTIQFKIVSNNLTPSICDKFLENYFNVTPDRILPGISLCRLALLYKKGDISYQLKKEDSLEFDILLPVS